MKRESREEVIEDIYSRLRRLKRDIDRDTVKLYFRAVEELAAEGDAQASIALNFLMLKQNTNPIDGRVDPDFKHANVVEWASNIHHNNWGNQGLGGRLKARVVILRMRGEKG